MLLVKQSGIDSTPCARYNLTSNEQVCDVSGSIVDDDIYQRCYQLRYGNNSYRYTDPDTDPDSNKNTDSCTCGYSSAHSYSNVNA
jgi:hypothetical protein